MTMEEAQEILQEIKHYLTAGNPVWDVDEIAEACDMAIEALRNEINCVKCEHYTERETYTGIKGVCNMDTAHREDLISRSRAIKDISYLATNIIDPKMLVKEDALYILETLPSVELATNLQPSCNQLATDLISRSDAIDAWWHDEVFFGNQRDDMTKEQWLDYITDIIGSLPSADLKKMVGCTGCEHYDQQQTARICRECRRYYKDKHSEYEGRMNDGVDSKRTKV